MAGYRGHVAGGVVTCFIAHFIADTIFTKFFISIHNVPKHLAIAFIFCILGSLFPDIDVKSVGQRIFYTLMTVAIFFSIFHHKWEALVALSLVSPFPLLVNHRGIIHTIWFVSLAPLCIPLLMKQTNPSWVLQSWIAYYYFVSGALSHLLIDFGPRKTFRKFW